MLSFLRNMFQKKLEWYSPKDPTPRVKCQCCEHISLAESGNYLICPVCFWEDEGMSWELDMPSGANHGLTIREGRANFLKFGACEPEMVKHVVSAEQRKSFEYRPESSAL